jgi:hypothetical protein
MNYMNVKFCTGILCFLMTLYYLTIIIVQVDDTNIFTTIFGDKCEVLRQSSTPEFTVAVRRMESAYGHRNVIITPENCGFGYHLGGKWRLEYRPLVGDHIHVGIVVRVNGVDVTLRDRNTTEYVAYEDFPATCSNPPEYAYVKKWYHTGVHTHCDNIIHVHPWSAPRQLRVTGKDVTLGMWFESVGIDVGSLTNSLRIPGYDYMDMWVLEYYASVKDSVPSFRTINVHEMENVWLVDHHGFIKLYRVGDAEPGKDMKVLNFYSKSKIGSKYPSRN